MNYRTTIKLIYSLSLLASTLMHSALSSAAIVTMESSLNSQNGYRTDFRFSYDDSTNPFTLDQNSSALKSFSWSVFQNGGLLHSQSIVTDGVFTSADGAWSFKYNTTTGLNPTTGVFTYAGIESLLTGEFLTGRYLFNTNRMAYGKIPYQNAKSLIILGNNIVSTSVYQPPFRVAAPEISAVPEPSTYAMIGLGLLGVMGMARRSK